MPLTLRHPLPLLRPGSSRVPIRGSIALLLLTVALAALVGSACREQAADPTAVTPAAVTKPPREGPPRSFALGFSAVPAALTEDSYLAAFDLAASHGEVLLVQRPPQWAEFLPDVRVSAELVEITARERNAAAARGLELLIALDPFDPATRDRLAALPPGYEGRGLDDPELRRAFIAEAEFIARNERPAYLALGTEVNATYERDPAAYRAFLSAYRDAYDAVKRVHPEIQVFVTFQFEQLLGLIPWEPPHTARWELAAEYEQRLDLFAITTFPSFAFSVARKVPPLYYRQIREHTTLPIVFAGAGFASAAEREQINSSTPAEQRRFLQRLLEDAEVLEAPLLVWFAGRDPAFAAPPYDLLSSIGLRTAADEPKEAWPIWEAAARRPYEPLDAGDTADGE